MYLKEYVIHCADKTLESEKYALIFLNPLLPYSCETVVGVL
ncbi:MAG: hypothetical protein AB7E37_08195 [Candidatus Altimarinota bacterium]|jgi:hypothetical protein